MSVNLWLFTHISVDMKMSRNKPARIYNETINECMKNVIRIIQFIGSFPVSVKFDRDGKTIEFSWLSVRTLHTVLITAAYFLCTVASFIKNFHSDEFIRQLGTECGQLFSTPIVNCSIFSHFGVLSEFGDCELVFTATGAEMEEIDDGDLPHRAEYRWEIPLLQEPLENCNNRLDCALPPRVE